MLTNDVNEVNVDKRFNNYTEVGEVVMPMRSGWLTRSPKSTRTVEVNKVNEVNETTAVKKFNDVNDFGDVRGVRLILKDRRVQRSQRG